MTLGLAGCVGDTDPASNITNLSAKLNAHGHTDAGPATWWWEYDTVRADLGTANDTEICGNPPEPDRRCGPASSSADVPLGTTVTGLRPNTTYFFRACGQDQGEGPTCGKVLSFKTLAGTSYALERAWGTFGSGNGQLYWPAGVATDARSNVYVAETGNDRIQKFSSSGAFITKWGTEGAGNGQFDYAHGVATDRSGNLYATEYGPEPGNTRVQKFSSAGAFITKWGSFGASDGQFHFPQGVATDPSGNVYVADANNERIQKFSSSGAFIAKWGSEGTAGGQFRRPQDVATDPAGNVFVADFYNHRIQKFSSSGVFVAKWDTTGAGGSQFSPYGMTIDSAGDVYVTGGSGVHKFSSSGAFITRWGGFGAGEGQFDLPHGVAIDPYGNVYVADFRNNRIQKFRPVQ